MTLTIDLTIETTLDAPAIAELYDLYVAAFAPMQTRAAARHLLSAEEFAAEMTDERIEKYVVRTGDGRAVALTTLATDLDAVTWVSPAFYLARYPQHAARGALFYLGYTLVDPRHASQGVFLLMVNRLTARFAEAGAVCLWDTCQYNDARIIGQFAASMTVDHDAQVERLDVQTYYAVSFADPTAAAPARAAGGVTPSVRG